MNKSKLKHNSVNPDTISDQIDNCIISFFDRFNIDINDLNQCKSISHNTLTLCMMSCYDNLFKPDKPMINNQRSIIDYNNIQMLTIIANSFIKWSLWFNKSLGLMQFSIFTGIHRVTLAEWRDHPEINSERSDIIKNIIECHKMEQISILNDSPVGALAVANNDIETGLEWSKNQVNQITNNTVYLLPSERSEHLRLDKLPE